MQGIVFVPGITGSELLYKKTRKIWPPDFGDLLLGYQKINELLDPKNVSVGNVIDGIDVLNITCDIIYKTTEEDLHNISNILNKVSGGPYCAAPYDWRQDLFQATNDLAASIDRWYGAPPGSSLTEITLVCHSMGGLIGRLLLEWKYAKAANPPKWFPLIRRLLCICTPHLGAPKALVESLGVEGASTISPADAKKLAADSDFPSGYELLPAPSRQILFDVSTNTWLHYDNKKVVHAFGLSQPNLDEAKKVATALDVNKKPKGVDYMFVYGTGLPTDGGVEVQGLSLVGAVPFQWPKSDPDKWGDGVVPAWSIKEAAQLAKPNISTWSGPGDHVAILQTGGFRQELYAYFGLRGRAPALVTDKAMVVVSLNKRVYSPGETIHGLIIADTETDIISGTYMLSRIDEGSGKMVPMGVQRQIEYRGAAPTDSLQIRLSAPTAPGAYRVDFGGEGASHRSTDRTAGWFSVTPKQR